MKTPFLILIYLVLSAFTVFGPPEDFAKMLQNKLNLFYSNNIPVDLQSFVNRPGNSYRTPDYLRIYEDNGYLLLQPHQLSVVGTAFVRLVIVLDFKLCG